MCFWGVNTMGIERGVVDAPVGFCCFGDDAESASEVPTDDDDRLQFAYRHSKPCCSARKTQL